MSTVNYANYAIDKTVRVYDKFYAYEASVPAQEYDAVYSYLASVFGTKDAAANFTVTMFRIASLTDVPVMNLLEQIKGLGMIQLTLTLSYYLNSQRSRTTLLGINNPTIPNYYVAHNIVQ